MTARNLSFVCDIYKECNISASALYDQRNCEWIPKAHLFWKKGNERHLATITTAKRFGNAEEAGAYALSLARHWCDEHIPGDNSRQALQRQVINR